MVLCTVKVSKGGSGLEEALPRWDANQASCSAYARPVSQIW